MRQLVIDQKNSPIEPKNFELREAVATLPGELPIPRSAAFLIMRVDTMISPIATKQEETRLQLPMDSNEEGCENCHFSRNGECRRRPPTPVIAGFAVSRAAQWPRVEATDWCGEFEPRRVEGG